MVPFAVFLGIYAASIGHGFVADDFGWILDSRLSRVSQVPSLFFRSSGFYRPIVGLTFAANYAVFGNHPLGYGLTNLALAIACGGLLYLVARELLLPSGAAILAVALWLLNPHGMNTAILWMSGRTSLMLTLGSLGAVRLVLRGRPFAALAPAARRWAVSTPASRRAVAVAGIIAAIGMTPVYLTRNRASLANARFSSSVLRDLNAATAALPDGDTVVVIDDRTRRPNIETAFNVALNDAFRLASGRRLNFWVEPALQHAQLAGFVRPCPSCAQLTVTIRDGHVVN